MAMYIWLRTVYRKLLVTINVSSGHAVAMNSAQCIREEQNVRFSRVFPTKDENVGSVYKETMSAKEFYVHVTVHRNKFLCNKTN